MMHNSPDKKYEMIFDSYKDTEIVFGDAAFTQLGEHALLTDSKIMLLILGGEKSSMKSGARQEFLNMTLGCFDLETPTYAGVPAEPDVDCVRDIVKYMETCAPDTVVAVGGGSVMDAAKAAYLSWQSGLDVKELFGKDVAKKAFPEKMFKRIICIPTTAGTGSEVTPYSNIVDRDTNLKYIINDESITPQIALVEPMFSSSMSLDLTRQTALDALTHAIESLLNFKAIAEHPEVEDWAQESIRLIHYALPRIMDDVPCSIEREMLSAAATLAGMCIRKSPTALPHLCSYSLWGKVPHGLAVSLFLPHFWRFYMESVPEVAVQTMKLADVFCPDSVQPDAGQVVQACQSFIENMSPVKKLSDIPGYDESMIKKIAKDASLNPSKLASAPRCINQSNAEDTLLKVLSKTL